MIMEAESLRPIGPAAEYRPYGACITSFEQRGCVIVSMYHCTYSTILNHSIHAEFMHVLVLYKTYKQAVLHKSTLKPK